VRILYVSTSSIPSQDANSVHVMKMCAAFAELGHEVVLYARDARAEGASHASLFREYDVGESFTFAFMKRGRWGALSSLIGLAKLALIARRFKPDLIYSRNLFGCVAVALAGRSSVFESHLPAAEEYPLKGRVLKLMLRLRRIPLLVVISDALRRRHLELGDTPARGYLVAPDGADPLPGGDPEPRKPGPLRVGYVGHLYPGKGMEVVEAIAPRLPHMEFHIVGGRDADIALWKARLGAANVMFHGFVPPARTRAHLAALDVCLLPNQRCVRTSREGLGKSVNISEYTSPLKMFEYMAAGKAIVSSRLPVLMEILDDTTALFADPEEPAEWVQALESLRDDALRTRLGYEAQRVFLERYTWKARARTVLAAVAA